MITAVCPRCQKTFGIEAGGAARAGDYCVCKQCGAVLKFTGGTGRAGPLFEVVRAPELDGLRKDHREVHQKIIEAQVAVGIAGRKRRPADDMLPGDD
jgi:hypothetical protein